MSLADLAMGALLALPHWHLDDVSEADRRALYLPTVTAISEASRTREDVAVLATLASLETRMAALVLAGRCSEMPRGVRCDEGRARGPWQLHRGACPEAWRLEDGSDESRLVEARCALRLWRGGRMRCRGRHPAGDVAGAFAGYRSLDCTWAPAAGRARAFATVLGRLGR